MANHIRQQIRERVGTTLTGLTTTGSNVFQSRVSNLEESNLPAIIIYTKSEAGELLEMGSTRTLQRNLQNNTLVKPRLPLCIKIDIVELRRGTSDPHWLSLQNVAPLANFWSGGYSRMSYT